MKRTLITPESLQDTLLHVAHRRTLLVWDSATAQFVWVDAP
jgi:hypothetical protein